MSGLEVRPGFVHNVDGTTTVNFVVVGIPPPVFFLTGGADQVRAGRRASMPYEDRGWCQPRHGFPRRWIAAGRVRDRRRHQHALRQTDPGNDRSPPTDRRRTRSHPGMYVIT